ncbi:MAG: hypothetical protein AAFY78_03185 [Cyanobacteria bacterium J06648_16]
MSSPHIEIKTRYVDSGDAKAFIEKGAIIAVVTTDKISKPAKQLLDAANIAWAEKVSEALLKKYLAGGD